MTSVRMWSAAVALTILTAVACKDVGPEEREPVESVAISPDDMTLTVGERTALRARVRGARGSDLEGRRVLVWTSSDETVALVEDGGQVTATGVGTTRISAESEGKSDWALITVRSERVPVASVEIRPAGEIALAAGATMQISAVAKAADGSELADRAISWSSSNEQIATVSASGVVSARAAGTATLTAISEGRRADATIRVSAAPPPVATVEIRQGGSITLPVGSTRQLDAVARAADGTELGGRVATWSSNADAIATVDAATGLVTARATGNALITVAIEGRFARIEVAVPMPVVSIEVSPARSVVGVGEAAQLTAQPLGAGNVPLERPVTWSSGNSAVATVDASARVTGRSAGVTSITATSEGKSRSVEVWVITRTEYRLLRVGDSPLPTTLFTVTETDANGATRTARWEARDGYTKLGTDSRYEQAIAVWIYRDGALVTPDLRVDRGTYEYDVTSGGMIFHPADGSPSFTGGVRPDGTFGVTRRLQPNTPELTFIHAVP